MLTDEEKALQLIKEAERKASSKGFFGFFFSNRKEEIAECYQRAANLFKMAKNWNSAGSSFCQAGDIYSGTGARHDAATCYTDAANCYKKSDFNEALNCLYKAATLYTDLGKFYIVAKLHQNIAEIYENDIINLEKAMAHYEQAADYFRCEESNLAADKCILKVAYYAALDENYQKAIDIYQKAATSALSSSLLKYTARENFFKAALCHFCVDVLNVEQVLKRYLLNYPGFQDSREYGFLKKLIDCTEEHNTDKFAEIVRYYDSVSRFDKWYIHILGCIKKKLNENLDLR